MFGKGRKHRKNEGPQLRQGRISVTTLWLVAALVCGAGLAYSNYQQAATLGDELTRSHEEMTKEAAGLIAPAVQAYIQHAFDSVQAVAMSPQLRSIAQASADTTYPDVTPLFAGASRAIILPKGFSSPDLSIDPPISFAVVAQIDETSASKTTLPLEVHWLNKQAVVETVSPILDEAGINTGYVLVTWPFEYFKEKLSLLKPTGGMLEIIQSAPGGTRSTLMELGSAKAKQNGRSSTVKLKGSHWLLKVYPAADPGAAKGNIAFPSATLWQSLVPILVVLIILAVVTRLLFKKDVAVFRRMLDDAQENRLKQRYTTSFKQSQAFSDLLRNQLREWTASRKFASAPAKVVSAKDEAKEQTVEVVENESSEEMDNLFRHEQDEDDAPPAPPGAAPEAPEKPAESSPPPSDDQQVFDIEDAPATTEVAMDSSFPFDAIKDNDIRGRADTQVTPEAMKAFGRAFGSAVVSLNKTNVVIGCDGRLSSESIKAAVIEGVLTTGCNVADIGMVPTPVLYFAADLSEVGGALMVTGSHNPPEFNGLKAMIDGETLNGEQLTEIARRLGTDDLVDGKGELSTSPAEDVLGAYAKRVLEDVHLANPLKIVVDGGNGVGGVCVVDLFKQLGCEVVDLYCDVDGRFPNHLPDTSDEDNLAALASMVRMHDADIGIAFDGDADRCAVVDSEGDIVWPDRVMMLLAQDILAQHPGSDVIFDIKCSSHLSAVVSESGGIPRMIKTGHAHLKHAIKEHSAIMGGELSGHFVLADRWFSFDDGIYAACRVLELAANCQESTAELFGALPKSSSTPEFRIDVGEDRAREIADKIGESGLFEGASVNHMDGIRGEFDNGWILIRASNTGPEICIRLEADDDDALDALVEKLRGVLQDIAPEVDLPI